jgi:hypothetical protein
MRRMLFVITTSVALVVCCAPMAMPATPDSQTTSQAQSPQAVLRSLMSAFNRHDFAALDTLFAPEGVYEDFAARFRGVGPAQVKNFHIYGRGSRRKTPCSPESAWQRRKRLP